MHTIELYEHLVRLAEDLGYRVRQEWLGGQGGGLCEYGGKRWIFVDLAQSSLDRVEQIALVLSRDPCVSLVPLPASVKRCLDTRRAA